MKTSFRYFSHITHLDLIWTLLKEKLPYPQHLNTFRLKAEQTSFLQIPFTFNPPNTQSRFSDG